MLDIKAVHTALETLEEERRIPKEKIIEAIEQALAAAYKKDFGKKGQIVRTHFNMETGETEFYQVKIVVDESTVRIPIEGEEESEEETYDENDTRTRFNSEHHIMIDDAKLLKNNVELDDEIIFPLETQEDFGRIAAQTAKQVIIQKIREAERSQVMQEFGGHEGETLSGMVQKVERGMVYVDFGRAIGVIPREEQIPGERLSRGQRIKVYLYDVDESPRGISLKLSRSHPKLIEALFASEAPEVASGIVEIRSIAREPGNRSKIAVYSEDEHIDPVGSCVGQKGIRVSTVMSELGAEKIDIIPWSEDPAEYVSNALSPARVLDIEINDEDHTALVTVADEQLSLAIGKGGQNVRLAAKLTGWRIDIRGMKSDEIASSEEDEDIADTENRSEDIAEELE